MLRIETVPRRDGRVSTPLVQTIVDGVSEKCAVPNRMKGCRVVSSGANETIPLQLAKQLETVPFVVLLRSAYVRES